MRAVKAAYQFRRIFSSGPTVFQKKSHEVSPILFNHYSKFNYENRIKNEVDVHIPRPPDDLYSLEDADNFGLLSRTNSIFSQKYEKDEGDVEEEKFLYQNPKKIPKLSTKMYADMIKEHLENKRLKEALDVLEIRMLQEDKKSPENYIYNLLIDGCGEAGYTKKAFTLFNDMKKRGLKTTGATYTSLFKACANSPWPADGRYRAKKLRTLMKEKLIEPNLTNYNCMIKTFGRCGDILTAFSIVDEMISKKIRIRVHTFNFLLQACISDKTNGFRHALIVWRKMLLARERPNIYSFNLMIRCAKECELGITNLDTIAEVFPQISSPEVEKPQDLETQKCLPVCNESQSTLIDDPNFSQHVSIIEQSPNLLAVKPHMGSVISVGKICTPVDRFTLIGGLEGFLNEMKVRNVAPNVKTFTQILDVIPNTMEYDEKLLNHMKSIDLKIDIEFFNILIKRRCARLDYKAAKEVQSLIDQENKKIKKNLKCFPRKHMFIQPDIITYGVWAMCCNTESEAKEFIENMKLKKIRVNAQIIGTLLKNAAINLDFEYVMFVMKTALEEEVTLNAIFFAHLYKFNGICIYNMNKKDKSSTDAAEFKDNYEKYKSYYGRWSKEVKREESEDVHPWKQYKENQPITFQKLHCKPKSKRIYKKKGRRMMKYVVRM